MSKKKSFVLYDDWGKMVVKLSDDQAGQLFKAICSKRLGLDYEIDLDAVDAIFSMISDKIDEDTEEYESTCQKRSENVKKRWNAKESKSNPENEAEHKSKQKPTKQGKRIQTDTTVYKSIQINSDNEYEYENDNENENDKDRGIPPISPLTAINDVPQLSEKDAAGLGVPPALCEQVSEWVNNRSDKGETLTQSELRSFVSMVKSKTGKYGAQAISDLIAEAMANGYKGVPWDRLERRARDKPEKSALDRLMEIEV